MGSLEEIIDIFKSTNANMSEDDIREQFSLFDTDNSGDLDIEEYGDFCSKTRNRALASVAATEKKPVRGSIQEPKTVSDMNYTEIAFSLFDQNRDGFISS